MKKTLAIQSILSEGWQEWKVMSLIFLVLVLLSSVLLMTSLPKGAVLWSSFVSAIVIPPLVLNRKKRLNKMYAHMSSHNMSYAISNITWETTQKNQDVIFRVEGNPNSHRAYIHIVA